MIYCNLKDILKEKNISATKLAEVTGVSRTAINQLANNNNSGIQFDTIEKVCFALKINISELLLYAPFIFKYEVLELNEPNNKESLGKGIITITESAIPNTKYDRTHLPRPIIYDRTIETNILTGRYSDESIAKWGIPEYYGVISIKNGLDDYLFFQELLTESPEKISSIIQNEILETTIKAYKEKFNRNDIDFSMGDEFSPLFSQKVTPKTLISSIQRYLEIKDYWNK